MNINEHPIYKNIYDLCLEIEKLPPSEQATKVVVMASALENPVRELLDRVKALNGIRGALGNLLYAPFPNQHIEHAKQVYAETESK